MKSALQDEHLVHGSLYMNPSKACVMPLKDFKYCTQGWRVNVLYYSLSQKRVEIYINYFQAKSSAIESHFCYL